MCLWLLVFIIWFCFVLFSSWFVVVPFSLSSSVGWLSRRAVNDFVCTHASLYVFLFFFVMFSIFFFFHFRICCTRNVKQWYGTYNNGYWSNQTKPHNKRTKINTNQKWTNAQINNLLCELAGAENMIQLLLQFQLQSLKWQFIFKKISIWAFVVIQCKNKIVIALQCTLASFKILDHGQCLKISKRCENKRCVQLNENSAIAYE